MPPARAKLAVFPRKALGEQRELVMLGRPKEKSDRIASENLLDLLDRDCMVRRRSHNQETWGRR
jgi:hypothetical protein